MNSTVIGIIVIAVLGGGAIVEGKLLLDAHEKIGDLRVEVSAKQAVIDQKNHDAEISERLAEYQTKIETVLKTTGNTTRQAITNATTDDDAARAALDGVRQLRAGLRPGSSPR